MKKTQLLLILLVTALLFTGCFKREDLVFIGDSDYAFSKDHKKIFYEEQEGGTGYHYYEIENVDLTSFTPLAAKWAQDVNNIYCRQSIVTNIDKESFILQDLPTVTTTQFGTQSTFIYPMDKNHVFNQKCLLGKLDIMTNLSPATTELVTPTILRDHDTYVFNNQQFPYTGVELDVDYDSFDIEFAIQTNSRWIRDGKTLQQLNTNGNFTIRSKDTWEILNSAAFPDANYFRMGNKIFYNQKQLDAADAPTFNIMPDNKLYAKDANHVYFKEEILTSVKDAPTFEFMYLNGKEHSVYAKDQYHYYDYVKNIEIDDIDYESFSVVADTYAKDHTNYYYRSYKIENIDYDSFTLIKNYLAKDNFNYYYKAEQIQEADYPSFQFCASFQYAEDKNNYYDFLGIDSGYKVIDKKNPNVSKHNVDIIKRDCKE